MSHNAADCFWCNNPLVGYALIRPIHTGSYFEVPQIGRNESVSRFPLATGESKKLYEAALAKAFQRARDHFIIWRVN
jgi:hypothetical protein